MFKPIRTSLGKLETPKRWGAEFFIKDESDNPTGTHKDRRSRKILDTYLGHTEALGIITAGNAGASLALTIRGTRLQLLCILDDKVPIATENTLREMGAHVTRRSLREKEITSDHVVQITRAMTGKEQAIDVTNGQSDAYRSIVQEILDDGVVPDTIVCPVGSGELASGIAAEIRSQKLETQVIGIRTQEWNGVADKLLSDHGPGKIPIEGIEIWEASIADMRWSTTEASARLLSRRMEASASVVLLALGDRSLKGSIVLVNTGKGMFA
ncbi:MAG: PLP-dependent lyase/thiolase [Candidatus Peribacteraceae bacterium]